MMNKYRERSRAQSEGSNNDLSTPDERGEFQRSVSLSRDLMSELDTVAEDRELVPKGSKGK
eukprot:10870471-Karenia_brevis.AAC.1